MQLPLLANGFRPFFFVAALYAVLVIPLWLATLIGNFQPNLSFPPMYWHGHEMLFGFTMAVVGGFLLTAVSNWTKRVTAVGAPLAFLVVLWIAGRFAMLFGDFLPQVAIAAVDLAFVPALAVAIGRPLIASKNQRTYALLPITGILFAANAVCHLDAMGVTQGLADRALNVAIDLILVTIILITGRIIPVFTRNELGLQDLRSMPALDKATALGMAFVGLLDAAEITEVAILVAAVTALFALLRMRFWGTAQTFGSPLVWVLHIGSIWIPIGLSLRAFGPMLGLPATATSHAFTAGAIGTLTLGMMTRVSLGHAGRNLVASTAMAGGFTLVTLGATILVATAAIGGTSIFHGALAGGTLWALSFAIYLALFTPALFSARPDGEPG
ncbi:MAG: NnrS family protein [Rhodobacterales bacterium]|nr:NnrS family protein [Rhodobacterales bacterium]